LHLVTQGDTLPAADAPVSARELLGVVVAVTRKGRAVSGFASPGRATRLVSALARRSPRFTSIFQRVHHRMTWRALPMVKAS
jgi:hypothetical protein